MKKLFTKFSGINLFTALPVLLLFVLSVVFISVWAAKPVRHEFNKELYHSYIKNQFHNLEQICDEFSVRQEKWIEIVPPRMPCLIQPEGIRCFNYKRFPESFVRNLVPVKKDGTTFYPVTICEDIKTRDYVFLNADGKEIYSVPAPEDYDPEWLFLLKIPAIYKNTLKTQEEIEDLRRAYDPARVAVTYNLITRRELINYTTQPARSPEQVGRSAPLMMKSYSGPAGTGIRFTSLKRTTNGMVLTIACPDDFTNRLDIFSCTNLLNNPWWDLVCTTNASETNRMEWIDTGVAGRTNGRIYYVAANADCTTATDPDGDGLPWGREKYLYHTSPTNSDTDGDSMPDGWEINHNLNPTENDANLDPDEDGLGNYEEYKLNTDPQDQSDGRALLETARAKIISHWYMVMTNDLSFENMKRAVIYGSAMASFCVEKFSTKGLEELSYLLWATQGVKSIMQQEGKPYITLRTVPSGGSRHPFETYILALNVTDLEKGIYRYIPLEHKLALINKPEDLNEKINDAAFNQNFCGKSGAVFVWSVIPYRTEWRYAETSYKTILLDAGHVCQNLYLSAESIKAGACAIAAYDQEKIDKLLDLDGKDEFVIYLAPVGKV
jgi:SagB-type dehydrogenase family enzyme